MQSTVIRSRDGLDLVSYLSLPRDADTDGDGQVDEPLPMVLLVHGQRQRWGYDPAFQLLANRGYAVLSVKGKQMQDDLLDAVDWAIAKGIAAKDQICILGGSYGGYATLVGLAMTPEVFACGVDGPGEPSPQIDPEAITKPLLIAQGGQVTKSDSDQIVAAMQAKHVPVSYVVFPDEGHVFQRPENDLAFWAVTEAFLSVQLGGWYQPITEAELKASSIVIEAGRSWLPGLPASRKVR